MDRLIKQLKQDSLNKLYFFTGDEKYLRDYYLIKLKETILDAATMDFNYHQFDGKGYRIEDVYDASEQLPVMSAKSMVVMRDTGIMGLSDPNKDAWEGFFKNVPEYMVFVIVDEDVDKRSRVYKAFKTCGQEVVFKYRSPGDLKAWVTRTLTAAHKKMKDASLTYFLENCDPGMTGIHAELEKLISFSGEREEITRSDIDLVVTKPLSGKFFHMVDAVVRQDARAAFTLLYELKELREPPVRVLAGVTSQFLDVCKARALLSSGVSSTEAANRLTKKGFAAKKCVDQARRADMAFLVNAISLCKKADYEIKSGIMKDWLSLEMLITSLTLQKH